jgi:predicted permease
MERTLEALRRAPGVTSAGATTGIPFESEYSDSVILAEGYAMQPGESLVSPTQIVVTPGYFETMGVRLASGRYFDSRDKHGAVRTVIVDEKLARKFWPNQNPLGRRMYQPRDANNLTKVDEKTEWLTVVGVVKPVRLTDLAGDKDQVGIYYFPYAQSPSISFTIAAATATGDAGALRQAFRSVDPELALFNVASMDERQEASLASRRTSMTLSVGLGALALFLSAMGIYGVLAYLVVLRSREIGIRVALGSTAAGVLRLVLREGMVLAGFGLALGLGGALAMRRAIQNEIYGVKPFDPLVLASAIGVLALVTLAACAWPARRAMRVDPVVVLNQP